MGRHSSDSDDNSRSKRKKKQRHRSSSSSSSSSASSGSRVKSSRSRRSNRRSRSRSRDRRRRRRSSSSSSHSSSRKRRSRSTEREKGRSHRSHKSPGRDRRSHSRHRRSRSRSDSRSHRGSRRRSHSKERDRSRRKAHDKDRTRGRDRDKDREKEKEKAKDKAQKKAESLDLKARLELLNPAEQAKVRMQLVLEAVAKTDEVLRTKVAMREEESRKKLEEEGTSVEDQVRRIKDIEAIESDSFVPQAFKSSRDDIKSKPKPRSRCTSSSLKDDVEPIEVKQEPQTCSQDVSLPISIIYNDTDTLAHPSLFLDKEKAEELWLNRLVSLRQERLMGSPVS